MHNSKLINYFPESIRTMNVLQIKRLNLRIMNVIYDANKKINLMDGPCRSIEFIKMDDDLKKLDVT